MGASKLPSSQALGKLSKERVFVRLIGNEKKNNNNQKEKHWLKRLRMGVMTILLYNQLFPFHQNKTVK